MKRSSTRVLCIAIAANIAIALSKYAAAAFLGRGTTTTKRATSRALPVSRLGWRLYRDQLYTHDVDIVLVLVHRAD